MQLSLSWLLLHLITATYGISETIPKYKKKSFKCPSKEHHIALGNECILNGFHEQNPVDTEYWWEMIDSTDIDITKLDFFDDVEETFEIRNDNQIGQLKVRLTMEHESNVIQRTRCHLIINFFQIPVFGIDLGTTYSCIAYQANQKNSVDNRRDTTVITADKKNRQYCIPTAIYFPTNNDTILFGHDALNKLSFDPMNVIYDIKRIAGRNWNDHEVHVFQKNHLFNLTKHDKNKIKIVIPNKNIKISPEQVLSAIIIHLVEIAMHELGLTYNENEINVVISIPAISTNAQRRAIQDAAKIAKLNPEVLLVEPTAAALAYSYYETIQEEHLRLFMVFDFGGGTLDCSIMRCHGLSCEVVAVSGNSTLGGIDFDRVIKDIIIHKLTHRYGIHPDEIRQQLHVILSTAEWIKQTLSTQDSVVFKYKGKTHVAEIIITRKEFENHPQTKQLLDSTINAVKDAFPQESKVGDYYFRTSNCRMVLMVGGTSKIPIIQERLKYEFGQYSTIPNVQERLKEKWGELTTLIIPETDPQLMVTIGTAVVGGSLGIDITEMGNVREIVTTSDVIPFSLGFEVCRSDNDCGFMSIVIPKNSRYPLRVTKSYCQVERNQTSVTMLLYEGNSMFVSENHYLSSLTIDNILPRNDMSTCDTFHIVFAIDENGIADIKAVIHEEDGSDGQVFTTSLADLLNDFNQSSCERKRMQNQMVSWFKSTNIQKLLNSTPCKADEFEEQMILQNYVYLDSSGAMHGHNYILGASAFTEFGESLIEQQTRITLFASKNMKKSIVSWNDKGQWDVNDIVSTWQHWNKDLGATYMWKMILDDVIANHKDIKKKIKLTIITAGVDNESPAPYRGLEGMDPMMIQFIKSEFNIEFNIVVLLCGDWNIGRYRDLCYATGGLFTQICTFDQDKFHQEFVEKYVEKDTTNRKQKIKQENKMTYERNARLGKATNFQWIGEWDALDLLKEKELQQQFECPENKEYLITLGTVCIVHGFNKDNPRDTEYQWVIMDTNNIDITKDEFYEGYQDRESYVIVNDNQVGQLKIRLFMEHQSGILRRTRCDLSVNFQEVQNFGILLSNKDVGLPLIFTIIAMIFGGIFIVLYFRRHTEIENGDQNDEIVHIGPQYPRRD